MAIEWLACRKIVKTIEKNEVVMEKTDVFVPSRKVSFSVITEKENEVEEEYRSASTTGTTINPYIIRTPTYSV